MEPKEYIQRQTEILKKKLSMLNDIIGYTNEQKEAIDKGDDNALGILIARKQERIEKIDQLDEQFLVYSQRLKSMLELSSMEELSKFNIDGTKELKESVVAVYKVLDQIRIMEIENQASLKTELSNTQAKMKQANSFKKVNTAYQTPAVNPSSFYFDKKK